jgi:hypothetical protein
MAVARRRTMKKKQRMSRKLFSRIMAMLHLEKPVRWLLVCNLKILKKVDQARIMPLKGMNQAI